MKYFGRDYGAGIYRDAERVPVPVWASGCAHCLEPFIWSDDGFIDAGGNPFHRACFLRGIIGSIAHIEKRCSCYVPGSECRDPPGMTVREAAEAAVRLYESQERK